jgi:hypothetical protein
MGIGKVQMLMKGNASATGSGSTPSNSALLVLFNGESNSVGYAFNTGATGSELGLRANTQILNTSSLNFQQLDIGVNNANEIANTHGWELEIANQINSTGIGSYNQVYLCKTGKGGTRISDWYSGGTWFSTMETRMSAALSILEALGKTTTIVCFYSQGINDIPHITGSVWSADTVAHFAKLRQLYGATMPIIMTKFFSPFQGFNEAMDNIVRNDAYTIAINPSGTTTNPDGTHWDYAGQKEMAVRMINAAIQFL